MAEGDFDADEMRHRAQQAVFELLTDTIRRDRYPSSTMMNIVESHMTEEQIPEYLDMLMEKVESENFPSMDMIRRIVALT